jgi:hypothetical protein
LEARAEEKGKWTISIQTLHFWKTYNMALPLTLNHNVMIKGLDIAINGFASKADIGAIKGYCQVLKNEKDL